MNKRKLKEILKEKGESQTQLAEALGLSRVTLSRKISEKNSASFTLPEISFIRKRYNLSDEVASEIFFAD